MIELDPDEELRAADSFGRWVPRLKGVVEAVDKVGELGCGEARGEDELEEEEVVLALVVALFTLTELK